MKAILIGGTAGGVGMTTMSTGLMAALRRRGIKIQPFRAGPDDIDPGYHTLATGECSQQLDTWKNSQDGIKELFHRAMIGKDLAIIEGMKGFYDGCSAISDDGSTACLSKILGVPVILILDSKKGARSLAAMVMGFRDFDKSVDLGGVILNGIGSDSHLNICRTAIEHYTGVPVSGYLPKKGKFEWLERHPGSGKIKEPEKYEELLMNLANQFELTFNLDEILKLSGRCRSD